MRPREPSIQRRCRPVRLAYRYLPDASTYDSIRITLPSRLYDPRIGADLYHRYLAEWQYAEEMGLDLMVNEHHATATNLNPSASIVTAALAARTTRARLLILGIPIANRRDPVRVAEETAMLDNYARGRLEVGFVRGVAHEVIAANSSPVRMYDRMHEAHDLILKAWTSHDGPFNWEGRFFQHREVNVWPRVYQQPHPPVWITTQAPEQIAWTADHGYVAATFLSGYDETKRIFDGYRARRSERGLPTPLDRLAYAAFVYVGETDDAGFAGGEKLLWYLTANKVPPQFKNPPGYTSVANAARVLRGGPRRIERPTDLASCIDAGMAFAGSPDTVFAQIKRHYERVGGYGNLLLMGQAGFLEHDETLRGIRLFAREVFPRLRELTAGQPLPAYVRDHA